MRMPWEDDINWNNTATTIVKGEPMRLIDADMLLNSFKGAKKLGVDAIKYYVDNTPTIDLVRCGECKHYGFKETDRGGFPCCTNVIGATPYRMPTDFCSYGERRADEERLYNKTCADLLRHR